MSKEKVSPESVLEIPAQETREEKKRRETLAKIEAALAAQKEYYHQLYDIYPQSAPETQELIRILRFGRNGHGLESPEKPQVDNYFLCRSDEKFAFALGRDIYVSTHLINESPNEDTIAAYTAHEIEHIAGDHILKRNNPEKLKGKYDSLFKKVTISRIHEYEADTTAPFKLENAGYNPTIYNTMFKVLLPDDSEDGIDMGPVHGSLYDRMSIHHLLLKAEDFSLSNQEPTEKPKVITNLPEQKNNFLLIVSAIEKDDKQLAQEICQKLSMQTLSKFLTFAAKKIFESNNNNYYADENDERKKKKLTKEQKREVKNSFIVFSFFFKQFRYKVNEIYPDHRGIQQSWLDYALLFHLTNIDFKVLNSIETIAEENTFLKQIEHNKYKTVFLETFSSLDSVCDFYSFICKTTKPYLDTINEENPINKTLWFEIYDSKDKNSLFLEALAKKFPSYKLMLNEHEFDMKKLAEFLYKIKCALNSSSDFEDNFQIDSSLRNREEYSNEMNCYYRNKRISAMYDGDTLKIRQEIEKDEPKIFSQLIQNYIVTGIIGKQYSNEANYKESYNYLLGRIRQDIYKIVEMVYSRILSRNEVVDKSVPHILHVISYLRPDDYQFIYTINAGDYKKAVDDYLQKNTINDIATIFDHIPSAFVDHTAAESAYIYILNYMKKNSELVFEQNKNNIRWYLSKLEEFVIPIKKLLTSSKEDVVVTIKNNIYHFSFEEIGSIFSLDIIESYTKKLEDHEALSFFENYISQLDVESMSDTAIAFLFPAALKTARNIYYRSSKMTVEVDQLEKTYLNHPMLVMMRDKYLEILSRSNLPIGQTLHQVQLINELLRDDFSLDTLIGKDLEDTLFISPILLPLLESILNKKFNTYSVDDLELLHTLLPYFESRRIAITQQHDIEKEIVTLLKFDDAIEYLDTLFKREKPNFDVFDYIQEKLLLTKTHMEKFEETRKKMTKSLSEEGSDTMGIVVFLDMSIEWLLSNKPFDFFDALITNQEDDSKLRALFAEVWFDIYCNPSPMNRKRQDYNSRPYTVRVKRENNTSAILLEGHSFQQFVPFNTFINQIYDQTTQTEINILVRKLLFNKNGLLTTAIGRKKLYDYFTKSIDYSQNAELQSIVIDLTKVILAIDKKVSLSDPFNPITLANPIAQILNKQLLIKPSKKGSNSDAIKALTTDQKYLYFGLVDDPSQLKMSTSKKTQIEKLTENEVALLLEFDPDKENESLPEIQAVLKKIDSMKKHLTSVMRTTERLKINERLTPLKVLIQIAKSKDTLGERFLQLIGYYVNLPPTYKKEIQSSSYDSIRGQLKYTAMRTLKREAEKPDASVYLQSFWENLEEFHTTGKGGSLTTVFRAVMKDGSQKAVKVMVPNALHFIQESKKEVHYVLNELMALPHHKKNRNLKLASILVDDIAEWAELDIKATDYEKLEQLFQEKYDGTVYENGAIIMKVPTMTPTGTIYLKIEDWIEGDSLISLTNSNRHQEVVTSVTRAVKANYSEQLTSPMPNGMYLIHPNVHSGQFQIQELPNGTTQVHILDRGFWLEFTSEEAQFFNFITGKDSRVERSLEFLQYLLALPENSKLSKMNRMKLSASISLTAAGLFLEGASAVDAATEFFIQLRKAGIRIPLKWTLLQQNEKYLDTV